MLRFLSLSLCNFRSYQALDISLWQQGAVVVLGRNGAGKSNIFSGLTWVLYGDTCQGIPVKELIRRGAHKAVGVVEFVSRAGDRVVVRRERTTIREAVFLTEGKRTEELGGREAEKRVARYLGVGWEMFTNTVFVGRGTNRYFLMLRDSEKKRLLEDLLDLERLRNAHAAAAGRARHLTARAEAFRNAAQMSRHALERLKKDMERVGARTMHRVLRDIRKLKERVSQLQEMVRKSDTLAWGAKYDKMAAGLSRLDDGIRDLSYAAKFERARIGSLTALGGKECPECERTLSEDEAARLAQKHRRRVVKLDQATIPLQKKREEFRDRAGRLRGAIDGLAQDSRELAQCCERLKSLELERDRAQADYRKILGSQQTYYKKRMYYARQTHDRILAVKPYFDFWADGYGSRGIKTDLLAQLLPSLEERSNDYLSCLSDHFTIEFSMNDGLLLSTIYSALGEMSYASCSTGERKCLDLATSLALRDVVESVAGVETNLLILDEAVEGLDAEVSERFAGMVQNLPGIRDARSVFVISHNEKLLGGFDSALMVEKQNAVSTARFAS